MDDKYIRQQELVNQEKLAGLHIAIVGCGAVGSFTALSLCKMGIGQLTLIDHDKVSVENLPNQFYRDSDLGKKKVDACSDLIRQFDRQISMITLGWPFIKQKLEADVVIAAVDSMEVRKRIWTAVNSQRLFRFTA
jgi:molybdopterin/thiamine biosynthesis adenylyltransferase